MALKQIEDNYNARRAVRKAPEGAKHPGLPYYVDQYRAAKRKLLDAQQDMSIAVEKLERAVARETNHE